MKTHKTLVDIDKACNRDQDVYRIEYLPKRLEDAKGILVKEDRSILPSYQVMPHPLTNIAHAAGIISDKDYKIELRKVGVFADESEMYRMESLVEGLLCSGADVYLSCIWLSDDLKSGSPAALTLEHKEWDYYFKPKEFNIGESGRILIDGNGQEYVEELYVKTSPEMVWGSLFGGIGVHAKRAAIHMGGGELEQVIEDGEEVKSAFDRKATDFRGRFKESSNFLSIDLESLPIPHGWSVKETLFSERLKDYKGGIFIFETNFDDWKELFSYVNSISNNIVWKALQLYDHCWSGHPDVGTGNNLFSKCLGFPHYHWVFYTNKAEVDLGRTGRSVRIADNYGKEKGYEWLSNWQTQYLSLKFGRELLLPAIFLLEDALKRVALDKSLELESGYQVFYDKNNPNITPENPQTIHEEPCSISQRRREQPFQAKFFIPSTKFQLQLHKLALQ